MALATFGTRQAGGTQAEHDGQTGLWGYTRHPNCLVNPRSPGASGSSVASRPGPFPALFTLVAPLAITSFLVFASGARLLEQTMTQRPGYLEYAARTSMFFPLPPNGGLTGPASHGCHVPCVKIPLDVIATGSPPDAGSADRVRPDVVTRVKTIHSPSGE